MPNVEVLVHSREYALSVYDDVSQTIFDYYANSPITGLYPVIACEKLLLVEKVSYIIVASEVPFADFKNMYDQYTEKGIVQYGQMFVDNLVSFFFSNNTDLPIINEYQKGLTIVFFSTIMISISMTIIRRKRNK